MPTLEARMCFVWEARQKGAQRAGVQSQRQKLAGVSAATCWGKVKSMSIQNVVLSLCLLPANSGGCNGRQHVAQ